MLPSNLIIWWRSLWSVSQTERKVSAKRVLSSRTCFQFGRTGRWDDLSVFNARCLLALINTLCSKSKRRVLVWESMPPKQSTISGENLSSVLRRECSAPEKLLSQYNSRLAHAPLAYDKQTHLFSSPVRCRRCVCYFLLGALWKWRLGHALFGFILRFIKAQGHSLNPSDHHHQQQTLKRRIMKLMRKGEAQTNAHHRALISRRKKGARQINLGWRSSLM